MLLLLYVCINYLGKEYVNYGLLAYMAVGNTTGIKDLLKMVTFGVFDGLDKNKLVKTRVFSTDIEISFYDIVAFGFSLLTVYLYLTYQNWIYNNILGIGFCIHALTLTELSKEHLCS